MRSIVNLAAACFMATFATAQGTAEYLKLRNAHGVKQAVGVAALETLVGERVVEVAGTVKGSFRMGDRGAIMLEKTGGDVQVVDCKVIPDWLLGNEVKARLLVKAVRADDGSELKAELIAAAPEADIAAIDKRAAALRSPPKNARKPAGKEWTLPASEVTPIYASFIKSRNKRLTNREALDIATGIVGFSLRYGVDARLIMAMVMVESGFNPNATSRSGAQGLGQLMPGTARGMGVVDSYDKIQNLYGTVRLIRGHLDKYKSQTKEDFSSLVLALAAYNAGGGAVRRHGGVPPYRETQNYIRKVIATYYALAGKS